MIASLAKQIVLVCIVSIFLPLTLDAYGFKDEAVEACKYTAGFLIGLTIGAWFL